MPWLATLACAALAGCVIHESPPPPPPRAPAEPAAEIAEPEIAEPTSPPPAPSTDPRLARLYRCWFESPYPYMFAGDTPEGGVFVAGMRGIVYYGNLADCMGKMADGGDYRVVGDHTPIERFTGLEVLVRQNGDLRRFNPALIRWGHENLIPDPATRLGDRTAGERYRDQFQRFFRLMAEAYLRLRTGDTLARELEHYLGAVTRGQDGLDVLEARFAGWLPAYAVAADGTAMTVPMAVGFWLRRANDDTAGELWIGLRKVLLLYDAAFYGELRQRYPESAVRW